MSINKQRSKLKVWCFKMPNASYTQRWAAYEKRANAQIAHLPVTQAGLVFADTQANPKKPKEIFFSQHSKISSIFGYIIERV